MAGCQHVNNTIEMLAFLNSFVEYTVRAKELKFVESNFF